MIEIMCRDGSVSDEELEVAAGMLRGLTNSKVEVLPEESRRAMAFWGPGDVAEVIESFDESGLDSRDVNLCDEILQSKEGELHQAMISAGWDVLYDAIEELNGGGKDPDEPDLPLDDEEVM